MEQQSPKVGRPGEPVFALALRGGGLDTALQLGAAHALLASGGRAPDVVAGISIGAVNGAAIAEVLQARASGTAAQKLRHFIQAYETAPDELVRSVLPDPLEFGAGRGAGVLRLPLYPEKDRDERQIALKRRRALVKLLDWAWGLRISVRALAAAATAAYEGRGTVGRGIALARRSPAGAAQVLLAGARSWLRTLRGEGRARTAGQQFLADRQMLGSLAGAHGLRSLFIRLFDPYYDGAPDMNAAIELALAKNRDQSPFARTERRPLGCYRTGTDPVDLVVVAANLQTGHLDALPATATLVDALLAANSVVPLFPSVEIGGAHYVDGANVADEPVAALIRYLRDGPLHPEARIVHIYPVASVPSEGPGLEAGPEILDSATAMGRRALELEKVRRARVERRLTDLYSRMLPAGRALHEVPVGGRTKRFLRTSIHPIEPDVPVRLGERFLEAETGGERRKHLLAAVAAGCRATLESTLQPYVAALAGDRRVVTCAEVLARRRGDGHPSVSQLPEVCAGCSLRDEAGDEVPRALRVLPDRASWPVWPLHEALEGRELPLPAPAPPLYTGRPEEAPAKPQPMRSLLFSGGVFRGVYQLGVLAALADVLDKPDVVAGAAVGTLTAAMAGERFTTRGESRRRLVAELAATYLAIDRLVLTDRLADAVQRLHATADETRFTLREARELLGPVPGGGRDFEVRRRRLLGEIQRLAFIGPAELERLIERLQARAFAPFTVELMKHLDRLLERSGLGSEILGSESLAAIVRERILARKSGTSAGATSQSFARFGEDLRFLATTTDLLGGRLVVLGGRDYPPERVSLLEGFLASSAFPLVFRPRRSWEVSSAGVEERVFVDGGILDNLPLDAVARHLDRAYWDGQIARRPEVAGKPVPHLLLTASLEPEVDRDADPAPLAGSWSKRYGRVKQLRNNRKVEQYARVQSDLRSLYEANGMPNGWMPLDVEVVNVVPSWLVETFGFHPMLGFREEAQAASIAHGCSGTFRKLASMGERWVAGWKIDLAGVRIDGNRRGHELGECIHRPGVLCPFGRKATAALELDWETRNGLAEIHRICPLSDRKPL